MSAANNDRLFLDDILARIARIEVYTQGGKATFFASILIQDGVIRRLEVIGEATKRLSPELRSANPAIPWRQLAGLRDVLIHHYGNVDLNEVWNIIERDLPGIKLQLLGIVL